MPSGGRFASDLDVLPCGSPGSVKNAAPLENAANSG
jgi:hypothetical protein